MKLQELTQKLGCRLEGDPSERDYGCSGSNRALSTVLPSHLVEVSVDRKKSRAL